LILKVIGSWAPFPRAGESCSGYLIETGQHNVLIDCGHGVMSQLALTTDLTAIDTIIISHFHPDHFVDLYAMRHFLRGAKREGLIDRKVRLLIPSSPNDDHTYWLGVEEFDTYVISDGMQFDLNDAKLVFHTMHHPLATYGVKAASGNQSIFYSADTSFAEDLIPLAQGVNVLMAEVSGHQGQESYASQLGHMTTAQAAAWASASQVDMLLGIHLWPFYKTDDLQQELTNNFAGASRLAYSGLAIDISSIHGDRK